MAVARKVASYAAPWGDLPRASDASRAPYEPLVSRLAIIITGAETSDVESAAGDFGHNRLYAS
jgi:hypothetical protein